MPDIKKEISGRLKVVRQHLNMTVSEFAQAIGVESQTVRDYENGKSIPGADKVGKLIGLGVDSNWLLAGPSYDQAFLKAQLTPAINLKNDHLIHQDQTSIFCKKHLLIDQYKMPHLTTDSSFDLPDDHVVIHLSLNAMDWRDKVGINKSEVKVITISGDSMLPTLKHGDQVFIDTTCEKIIEDAMYAIEQNNSLRIKRIKLHLNGTIEVKNDNNHGFAPEKYTAEEARHFKIIGKLLPFKFGQFNL
jgi:transcriptional regulator with XRE-family HTH domain